MAILVIFMVASFMLASCSPVQEVGVQESVLENEEIIRYHYKERYVEDDFNAPIPRQGNLTMYGFSWKSCGSEQDDIQVATLSVSPDPIVIPGNVTVNLDATIKETIQTASSLALVVKKKLFGVYIEVPCVDNFGSCTYENPCNVLLNITCPPQLVALGWTCRCPIPAKEYKVPEMSFKIPKLPIPSSLEDGDYEIQATLMNGSTRLGCYKVDASLKAN